MSYLESYSQQMGGFDFSLAQRNKMLQQKGIIKSKPYKKTGTTIVGLKFKDGIVLAADTRATGGSIVVQKNTQKIHTIAPNIRCCGAGTSADVQFVTLFMSSNLQLQRLNSCRQTRISSFVTSTSKLLYRYQGYLGAYLIVGGYDVLGPHLVAISAEGNYSYQPFCALGSGSLQALTLVQNGYKDDMSRDEAIKLAINGISAGIYHDLGSGSNVDYCVITKGKVQMFRNALKNNQLHDISL